MDRGEREARRDTFLSHAEDYAAARPGYPDEVLEAALSLGSLGVEAPILEVGCGTGELTLWLAARGFRVRAVDRSAEMVALAARRLAPYPDVSAHHEDFEEGSGYEGYAGLWFGTSYHWLDPRTRVERCAAALRPGGALVLLWHVHPLPYTGFFARVEPIYRRVFPGRDAPASPGMSDERLLQVVREIEASPHFTSVARRSHVWSRTYDRTLYLRLLNTYSDHQRLPGESRRALYDELSTIIDSEYGGEVTRPYRTELVVARRTRSTVDPPGSRSQTP